jgi:hypothetical protein
MLRTVLLLGCLWLTVWADKTGAQTPGETPDLTPASPDTSDTLLPPPAPVSPDALDTLLPRSLAPPEPAGAEAGAERQIPEPAPPPPDLLDTLLQQRLTPLDSLMQQRLAPADGRKSPARAFLFSAAFPGAGELYGGARKRGMAFSALEIIGIGVFLMMDGRGDRRKQEVIAFANAHWDSSRCPECTDPAVGTEQLGPYGSQQYYEQIGKYNKFQAGWDDYDPDSPGLSPNRQAYVAMRHRMNQAYKWAGWTAGMVLLNHAVSAIHAGLTVRAHNRAGAPPGESRLRIRLEGYNMAGEWAPAATVSYRF